MERLVQGCCTETGMYTGWPCEVLTLLTPKRAWSHDLFKFREISDFSYLWHVVQSSASAELLVTINV